MHKILLLLFILISTSLFAQDYFNCGLPKMQAKMLEKYPQIKNEDEKLERFTEEYISENPIGSNSRAVSYIIPVVFHIIHNNGPENISDAQVIDAVRVMNEDFQKLNADYASTIALFQPIAADCQIEFRLARKDPNGNCTNGIDRIQSIETYNGSEDAKLNGWPRNKYLNIWVINTMASEGTAGYSFLPSSAQFNVDGDGIILLHTYMGAIGTGSPTRSHALSHEVGHWINLSHPWGNTNDPGVSCGNDNVNDTPQSIGWTTCNLGGNVCNPGTIENIQNFMEYSYCSTMFTNGQKSRMQAALNSTTAQRSSLWTAANLIATGTDNFNYADCAPIPIITPNTTIYTCAGDTITLSSASTNGPTTSWNWSLNGGFPSVSTDSSPEIIYNTAGVYPVSLTASNATGSNSTTIPNYVVVLPATAENPALNYFENFENLTFPGANWVVNNPSGFGWQKVTTLGYSGTNCLRLNNGGSQGSSSSNIIDEFITPTYDLTTVANPDLYFRVAFALKAAGATDALKVYISTDCGNTWKLRFSKSGNSLRTTTTTTSTYVPSSDAEWRQESLNLSTYAAFTNVRFKFQFTYNNGSNIYIDDINFNQPTSTNDINRSIALSVFPNPSANKRFAVSFNLTEAKKVRITLMSIDGKEISLLDNELIAGHQLLTFNTPELPSGMYFLQVRDEDLNVYVQKLILE